MAVPRTIAAIATPPGFGAVGVVRISGTLVPEIAKSMIGRVPASRFATVCNFRDATGGVIDQGIALFFPMPRSFTGEDVLELQGHGGPVVLDLVLRRVLELGARPARPGEFSERAFLNGKIDLLQAEAIADLIESRTNAAARSAARSLQGEFSTRIAHLEDHLVKLRTFLEAAIDFSEEEVDFMDDSEIVRDLGRLIEDTEALLASARRGCLVREGLRLVIAGPPNAGKSSLLNALAGMDVAIVTEIPGTTRDALRQEIQIDGMPLQIVDTAGLRRSVDPIEREGVKRALEQIDRADHVIWVFDSRMDPENTSFDTSGFQENIPVTFVCNKIDLSGIPPGKTQTPAGVVIAVSARTGDGLNHLRDYLKNMGGCSSTEEGEFLARRRHLDALERVLVSLDAAMQELTQSSAIELAAEDIRLAQRALGEITGEFTTDDLLERIFSSFCIGK